MNTNTSKIKIYRPLGHIVFDLIPILTLFLLTRYGLSNPAYQRKKTSPKNMQLTAPNAR